MGKYQKTEFSDQLRVLMKVSGINQKDLANAIGVSQGSVSGWMNGAKPNSSALGKLTDYFGCTTDYLLCGDETHKRRTESEARIKEAAAYADRCDDKEIAQILFEKKLLEQHAEEFSKRADIAEKKLEDIKDLLRDLLNKL